jgi:hypothetical protein
VPDSGVPAALGFAQESGIPFEFGIIRNHYVGRTFIEPADHIRHLGVKLKHNANRAVLNGKRVVLVDDSIVRGTTSIKIVQMVREAGAGPASTASTRRSARSFLPRAWISRRWPAMSASTVSASSPSTGFTALSASLRATTRRRNIAMPASPAIIQPP